jgi:hypothetical protein
MEVSPAAQIGFVEPQFGIPLTIDVMACPDGHTISDLCGGATQPTPPSLFKAVKTFPVTGVVVVETNPGVLAVFGQ